MKRYQFPFSVDFFAKAFCPFCPKIGLSLASNGLKVIASIFSFSNQSKDFRGYKIFRTKQLLALFEDRNVWNVNKKILKRSLTQPAKDDSFAC